MTAVKINFESLEFKNSSISSVSSIKNIFARMASTCSGAIEIRFQCLPRNMDRSLRRNFVLSTGD